MRRIYRVLVALSLAGLPAGAQAEGEVLQWCDAGWAFAAAVEGAIPKYHWTDTTEAEMSNLERSEPARSVLVAARSYRENSTKPGGRPEAALSRYLDILRRACPTL